MKNKRENIVNLRLPSGLIAFIDELIMNGYFSTRSEAIRFFVRKYIERDVNQSENWRIN